MPVQTDESKAAKALIKALDSRSVSVSTIAYLISCAPEAIKTKFLELVEHFMGLLSIEFDEGAFGDSDEYYRTLVKCRRIQDTIDLYKQ